MSAKSERRRGRPPGIPPHKNPPTQPQALADAILSIVRQEVSGRLSMLEGRMAQMSGQSALQRYREDAREMALFMMGNGVNNEQAAISQAYDFADMMEAEFGARMDVRREAAEEAKRKVEAEAVAEIAEAKRKAVEAAEAEGDDGSESDDDGEPHPDDLASTVDAAVERREGEPVTAGVAPVVAGESEVDS